jgi:L-lactate dehydrogenase
MMLSKLNSPLCQRRPFRTSRSKLSIVARAQSGPRIGVVGAGGVGSAIVSSLIHKNVVNEILISDVNSVLCEGVALDLEDEAFITGTHVESRSIESLRECDIIVITAGAKQQPGESRTNLIQKNASIMKKILTSLFPLPSNTVVLIVSNPVDILTRYAQQLCAPYISANQVIGSGTYLDSQRLRVALSKRLNVSVKSVHAYVLGEHGDSQVIARSCATVGGCKLDDMYSFLDSEYDTLEKEVKMKAYEIIKRKGATFHGIGACVAHICESIILNKKEIIPVSVYHYKFGTYLGWPAIVGSSGVVDTIPIELSAEETHKLEKSAKVIDDHVQNILALEH